LRPSWDTIYTDWKKRTSQDPFDSTFSYLNSADLEFIFSDGSQIHVALTFPHYAQSEYRKNYDQAQNMATFFKKHTRPAKIHHQEVALVEDPIGFMREFAKSVGEMPKYANYIHSTNHFTIVAFK